MTKALMIIDVQLGMFTTPGMTPHDGEKTIERIASLLDRARRAGVAVLFVQHDGGTDHPLTPGKPEFSIHPKLTPLSGENVIVKRWSSAFQGTDLHKQLSTLGVDHLIIAGMQTEFCVDSAVRGATERGYRLTLVADGHTTFDTEALAAPQIIAHHNATLRDFGDVTEAAKINF